MQRRIMLLVAIMAVVTALSATPALAQLDALTGTLGGLPVVGSLLGGGAGPGG